MAPRPLDSHHPDYPVVAPVVSAILKAAGGQDKIEERVPLLLRQAIDEVIDTPRTGRWIIEQTEKTEKTYLGTKVEIVLRNFLKFPKGQKLDMSVNGVECDIKNTMHYNWSIPRENVGELALLVKANEKKGVCSLGVAIMRDEYLNPGKNQDQKRSMSAIGQKNIWWIMENHPYPVNFWRMMSAADREALMNAGKGTKRVAMLFEKIQRRPISRNQIMDLAQQKDYMRRARKGGGARDKLRPKGIALLSGTYHQEAINHLGLGPITADEFISVSPKDAAEETYLRSNGYID